MQYTINQLYGILHQRVNGIYDIFKGFFGEANVDLQLPILEVSMKHRIMHSLETFGVKEINYELSDYDKPYEVTEEMVHNLQDGFSESKALIYVHWANVTVTNEYGKSIDIQDLYARIGVQLDGRIPYENHGFMLNRATYNKEQFESNYLHSHVNGIPKGEFEQFMRPCLGRGPINNTIGTLKNEYDTVTWMLFCQELSMYVTVESIQGIPYYRLENVAHKRELRSYVGYSFGNNGYLSFLRTLPTPAFKDFIRYYLEKGHLTLSYRNGNFRCMMPYHEYILDISNAFIDFYNETQASTAPKLSDCYNNGLLVKALLIDGKFYGIDINNHSIHNYDRYQGKLVLRFKGKDVLTSITDDSPKNTYTVTLLNNDVAMYILSHILRTINFRYKNEHYNKSREGETPSTIGEKVLYI